MYDEFSLLVYSSNLLKHKPLNVDEFVFEIHAAVRPFTAFKNFFGQLPQQIFVFGVPLGILDSDDATRVHLTVALTATGA